MPKSDFTANLAGEAQALGAIQAPTPEKTKVFLRKVLTLSEQGNEEAQQGVDTKPVSTPNPSAQGAAIQVTALTQTATTSPRGNEEGRGVRRAVQAFRGKNIVITASTTLNTVFESATSEIIPKTDRAIKESEKDNSLLKGTGGSFDLTH